VREEKQVSGVGFQVCGTRQIELKYSTDVDFINAPEGPSAFRRRHAHSI
jgi:hypothetical protein